jgi:hypothetical protein
MTALYNGAAVSQASAPVNVVEVVNPFAHEPDFLATRERRSTAYYFNVSTPRLNRTVKDADGNKSTVTVDVSPAQIRTRMLSTLKSLDGASPRKDGTIDYSTGALVNVAWKVNGKDMTLRMRYGMAINDGRVADDAYVTFAVKQADGTYKPWNIRLGNVTAIAGNK